jgi:hypothetical protein
MRRAALTLLVAVGLSLPALAEQPKEVTIVSPLPLPVDASGTLTVDALPPVEIAPGQEVELAPGQQVEATEPTVLPGDVLILQAFDNTNSGFDTVTFPKDVVLEQITVVPASIDTNPSLFGCGAIVRWPSGSAIDPASNDRIIVDHNWGATEQVSLNFALPYRLFLPAGTTLTADVGRAGGAGFCEALVIFTGVVQ